MEGTVLKVQPAVLKVCLLLIFLGLVTRSEAQATNCTTVGLGINACLSALDIVTLRIGSPSAECCTGLGDIAQLTTSIGANATCTCIQNLLLGLQLPGNILNLSAVILAQISGQCSGSILGILNPTINFLSALQCL